MSASASARESAPAWGAESAPAWGAESASASVGAGVGAGVGSGAGGHSSLGRHNMIGPTFWSAPLTVLEYRAVYSGNSETTVVEKSTGSTISHKDFSSLEKQHSRYVVSYHANTKRVVEIAVVAGYIKLHSKIPTPGDQ